MAEYLPCLVIVFNHKFDQNIEVLEELYSSRFRHIYFLVPFYTGNNPRVIPVYESSHFFQGYIAQGFRTFYRPEFTHYFFIGDDLILNPAVNERNYAQLLRLGESTSYIPNLSPLHEKAHSLYVPNEAHPSAENYWWHAFKAVTFYDNRKGTEAMFELPSREEAVKHFSEYGLSIKPLNYYNVFGPLTFPSTIRKALKIGTQLWTYYISWRGFKVAGQREQLQLAYPVVYSYSDIAIVSAQIVQQFCHLCGVFSAMGLFVEMAIPTALVLSGGQILTDAHATLKGKALWLTKDITALEKQYSLNLNALLADFKDDQLYYHPIKLSRWRRSSTSLKQDISAATSSDTNN